MITIVLYLTFQNYSDRMKNRTLAILLLAIGMLIIILTRHFWISWFDLTDALERTNNILVLDKVNYNVSETHDIVKRYFYSDSSAAYKIAEISFKFKVISLEHKMILVQTANNAEGITIDISQNGRLGVTAASINKNQSLSVQLTPIITVNKWYDLKLKIVAGKYLRVYFNGLPSTALLNSEIINKVTYSLNDITIGSDHLGAEKLNGSIQDLKIINKIVDQKFHQKIDFIAICIAVFLIGLALKRISIFWQTSLKRQVKIDYITFIVMAGFFISMIFHLVNYFYLQKPYPYTTFLFNGGVFTDFYINILTDQFLNPYYSPIFRGEYFPFTYVFVYPFTWFNINAALFLYNLIFCCFMLVFVKHYFSAENVTSESYFATIKNIFILSFMTYPFLFTFTIGNLESILFAMVASSLYCYNHNRIILAIFLLSMAGAIKLYPLIFILLFVSDKRYDLAISTVILTLLLSIGSLFILQPSFYEALYGWSSSLSKLTYNCLYIRESCLNFCSGLWSSLKLLYVTGIINASLMTFYNIYKIFSIVGIILTIIFVLFVEKEQWRKVLLLTCAILLFPIISADYKLLYFFIPLAMYVNSQSTRYDVWYASLFAMLLVPKSYYWIEHKFSIAIVINTLIILSLLITCLYEGIKSKQIIDRKAQKLR